MIALLAFYSSSRPRLLLPLRQHRQHIQPSRDVSSLCHWVCAGASCVACHRQACERLGMASAVAPTGPETRAALSSSVILTASTLMYLMPKSMIAILVAQAGCLCPSSPVLSRAPCFCPPSQSSPSSCPPITNRYG